MEIIVFLKRRLNRASSQTYVVRGKETQWETLLFQITGSRHFIESAIQKETDIHLLQRAQFVIKQHSIMRFVLFVIRDVFSLLKSFF